jgi:phosphotransferase system HPr-like phosphotransfer protein
MKEMNVVLGTFEKALDFVEIVSDFNEKVDLVRGRYDVDAKSILGVLSMDLTRPATLRVNTSDKQFENICNALHDYAA